MLATTQSNGRQFQALSDKYANNMLWLRIRFQSLLKNPASFSTCGKPFAVLDRIQAFCAAGIYFFASSPVVRKVHPEMLSPDARRSRNLSGFAPTRSSACVTNPSAAAALVPAGSRKIQGTLIAVSTLSSLNATTGTKHFNANCSERWLASRSSAMIASACSSISACTSWLEAAPQFCLLSTGSAVHARPAARCV